MSLSRWLTVTSFAAVLGFGAMASPSAVAAGSGASHAKQYSVRDLGTLGGSFSFPIDLNNHGVVVGVSMAPGDQALRGFVWKHGVMKDIGSLGGPQSAANSINSSGQIDGWSTLKQTAPTSLFNTSGLFCNNPPEGELPSVCRAIVRHHGHLVDLGTLGGQNSATGNRSINDKGQVVGVAETADVDPTSANGSPRYHAFLWQRTARHGSRSSMTDLGTLGDDPDSFGSSINEHGQVVAVSIAAGDTYNGQNGRGFLWHHGRKVALGTLGGHYSSPSVINNRGDIVGASSLSGDLIRHATLWRNGHVIDLGTLPGDSTSEAADITDRGLIVGTSCGNTGCHAVRWDGRKIVDLTARLSATAHWQLSSAQAANKHGQIAGDGQHIDQSRGYLLTPRCEHN